MIRRFNFTGRKKLPVAIFDIALTPGDARVFTAKVDLSAFVFPPEARLYLEAYGSGSGIVVRFPWGTVATPQAPQRTSLESLPAGNVLFDFKVVDESEDTGRILGVARGISLRSGGDGKRSLLPVNPVALGQQLWRVVYNAETPWLEVNNAIPDIMSRAQSDPIFISLVFPAVVREILQEVLLIREIDDAEDLSQWEGRWLAFAARFHPDRLAPPPDASESQLREWIEHAVDGFCAHYSIRDRFAGAPYSGTEAIR